MRNKMTLEYLLVLPVDPMPVGATYRRNESLPLHCTLMPWFPLSLETSFQMLEEVLGQIALRTPPLALVSERSELFGPNKNVHVHTLRMPDALEDLHYRVCEKLLDFGSLPKSPWIGDGYRPHVSDHNGRTYLPGTVTIAKRITLLSRNAVEKSVIREFALD